MKEQKLINLIKEIIRNGYIGDDVAFIDDGKGYILLTVDCAVENRHFIREWNPRSVGWKIVSANVSDITAKGGKPLFLLVSLGLAEYDEEWVGELYRGIREACEFYDCRVVGGNISSSENTFIDIFALGRAKRKVERGGAEYGDKVVLYGNLGMSRAGLEVLLGKVGLPEGEYRERLIDAHFKPKTAYDIRDHIERYATSSIDVSDGLVIDLFRMTEAGNYRINIESERLLKVAEKELKEYCLSAGKDVKEYLLYGGEDYAVVFTQKESDPLPAGAEVIGGVEEGKGVTLDGKPLEIRGFDHFSGFVS